MTGRLCKWILCLAAMLLCQANAWAGHSLGIREQGNARGFTITAHSGAYDTPDNSMEFIKTALQNKPDIIEIDVRMRPNGTLATSHDSITSNSDGVKISKVLKTVKTSGIRMNLDIKDTRTLLSLAKMLRKYGMTDQVLLTGINVEDIQEVKKYCPEVEYYLNHTLDAKKQSDSAYIEALLSLLKESGAVGYNCYFKEIAPTLPQVLHANGFKLSVWTVNEEKDIRKMLEYGADNITSRQPALVESIASKIQTLNK